MRRIPITIKIPVNVVRQADGVGLARIVINDLSSGLEKVSVRLLNRKPPGDKLQKKKPAVGHEIRRSSPTRFPVIFKPRVNAPPTTFRPAIAIPEVRYSVKTIHITLTWPTLPSLANVRYWLASISRRAWLRLGAVIVIIIVIFACLQLFGGHNNIAGSHAVAKNQPPQLTRGTPNYNTILPAGKTITQLGGWIRISPPNKDPVYTYVDKIHKVQINVSEQPLPKTFAHDTANKISQLAQSYNATDKFTASNNTLVYVASSDDGSQSVIFTKKGLLILIKSSAPVNNNAWTAYISSLQ